MITDKLKNNKGFALLFAVTISAMLLAIALGVSNIALKEINFSTSARNTNDAFFAADTGVECLLINDKSTTSVFTPASPSSFNINCVNSSIPVVKTGSSPNYAWDFTVLDLGSSGDSCAKVRVEKDFTDIYDVVTVVSSRGYNMGDSSCNSTSSSLVEREIEVVYGGSGVPSAPTAPPPPPPPPAGSSILTVSKGGTGTGTVTSTIPAGGINCGADCVETYTDGTAITLTASADGGSTFAGWSGGGCSGTSNCSFNINSNQTITATFNLSGSSNIVATGGTITTSGSYTYHTFTTSGTFQVTSGSGDVEVLVVGGGAGGGTGGTGSRGGGGAGGIVYDASFPVSVGSYTATVGLGTAGASSSSTQSANGGFSAFSTITALGGGGAGINLTAGKDGGSGGGGSTYNNTAGGTATQPGSASGGYGNNGGAAMPGSTGGASGGGGGAGGAGVNGVAGQGGNGGTGMQFSQFSSVGGSPAGWFGGGGGGGAAAGGLGGTGGQGGGGAGKSSGVGTAGVNGTGGGGGGSVSTGGRGGNGIVIVRYPSP